MTEPVRESRSREELPLNTHGETGSGAEPRSKPSDGEPAGPTNKDARAESTREPASPAAACTVAELLAANERLVEEYVKGYAAIMEDEDGREGYYEPTEEERYLIQDAIAGLLADDDFVRTFNAWQDAVRCAKSHVAESELQTALREATAIGIASLFVYCGAYESLSPHKRRQWDRLAELAKLADRAQSASVAIDPEVARGALPVMEDLLAGIFPEDMGWVSRLVDELRRSDSRRNDA